MSDDLKPRRVDVAVIRVGQPIKIESIDATLEAQQAIVGGLIQPVDLAPGLSVVVNEEGLILGLPFNLRVRADRWVQPIRVMGDCYFARWNEEGEIVSLHLEDMITIVESIRGI